MNMEELRRERIEMFHSEQNKLLAQKAEKEIQLNDLNGRMSEDTLMLSDLNSRMSQNLISKQKLAEEISHINDKYDSVENQRRSFEKENSSYIPKQGLFYIMTKEDRHQYKLATEQINRGQGQINRGQLRQDLIKQKYTGKN